MTLAAQCPSQIHILPCKVSAHDKQMPDTANRVCAELNCEVMAAARGSALLMHAHKPHMHD